MINQLYILLWRSIFSATLQFLLRRMAHKWVHTVLWSYVLSCSQLQLMTLCYQSMWFGCTPILQVHISLHRKWTVLSKSWKCFCLYLLYSYSSKCHIGTETSLWYSLNREHQVFWDIRFFEHCLKKLKFLVFSLRKVKYIP